MSAEAVYEELKALAYNDVNKPLRERYPRYEFGEGTYGGLQVRTWGPTEMLRVGKFCSFSFGVEALLGGEHRADWASTFPFPALPEWPEAAEIKGHPKSAGDITIGNDVWVGAYALLLGSSVIGDGAVVAARTVVSGHVAPYAVVAGNPMRFVRWRFPEAVRAELLCIKWWDWPRARLVKALPYLLSTNVPGFLHQVEEGVL